MVNILARMPEVDVPADIEARFAKAWRVASGQETPAPFAGAVISQRYIVIMTPGRTLMIQPCPPPNSMSPEHVQAIEKIAPAGTPLNIAVIAYTRLDSLMEKEQKAIPFLGYLLGLSYIGHSVLVFEGHPSAFKAGCRDADLLIVDAAMVPHLQRDWMAAAWGVMRSGADIVEFGRDGKVKRLKRVIQ
ncbi:MAG TPA: hypothetical protein VFP86_09970 [bacterium]|nr:hypothetical protein [bacterium]